MKLIYQGKTKDVYELDENQVLLKFKDDVTGENGVFDPGANTVGLSIEGAGKSGLKMTKFFFEILNKKNIQTHYIDADLEKVTMTVRKAQPFGKGLEVICRLRAVGSFFRRYGAYCEEGQKLDKLVEVTLKDDQRKDPVISADTLDMLGILQKSDYEILKLKTQEITQMIAEEYTKKGLELYDIKLEFGRDQETGDIILIDEISGGNMRVYKDDVYLAPLDLEKEFLK